MATLPKSLLRDVYWSFAEPIPSSPEALVGAAEEYAGSIEVPSPALALRSSLPFSSASVNYQYMVRGADGKWENVRQTIRVQSHTGPLTGASLLWELHIGCQGNVASGDHYYFEGLELLDGSSQEPVYELCLGS